MITSLSNPQIKDMIKLRKSSVRRERRLVIVEGIRENDIAFRSERTCRISYLCEEYLSRCDGSRVAVLQQQLNTAGKVEKVSCAVFDKMAFGERHEGVLSLFDEPSTTLPNTITKNPLILIADDVEKPGNIGAMMRTADAVGIDLFIASSPACDVFSHHVVRASAGTALSLPVAQAPREDVLRWLIDHGMSVVCADPHARKSYCASDFSGPTAFVCGREDSGLDEFWHTKASVFVNIPMAGIADSLNVSVSAAILLFEARRQRTKIL